MDDKGLTGNDMFNMVKEECERILNQSNNRTNKTENSNTLYVSLNNNEPNAVDVLLTKIYFFNNFKTFVFFI